MFLLCFTTVYAINITFWGIYVKLYLVCRIIHLTHLSPPCIRRGRLCECRGLFTANLRYYGKNRIDSCIRRNDNSEILVKFRIMQQNKFFLYNSFGILSPLRIDFAIIYVIQCRDGFIRRQWAGKPAPTHKLFVNMPL